MYKYKCEVRRVVDGDTVDVDIDLGFDVILKDQRIRLVGIDTAEVRNTNLEQKWFGLQASDFVSNILVDRTVVLHSKEFKGKFGRILGDLYIKEYDKFLTEFLLEKSLAIPYTPDSTEKNNLINEAMNNYKRLEGLEWI